MSDKKNAIVTVAFLCAIMLMLTVADFFVPDKIFSQNENRILASKPPLDKKEVISGEFMEDYEEYVTDQFVSRDTWIMLKTRGDILLQKKDINGIYIGKDGHLLEQHLPSDIDQKKIDEKIALLKPLMERYHTKVMLIPTADNIISDKLPAYAQYYDQRILMNQVKGAVGRVRYIDVYDTLKDHSEEYIYYKTDHHWTTLGAYYGYLAWADKLGKQPHNYDMENMEVVSDEFLGTLHSRINLPSQEDTIFRFPETLERSITVTYDFQTSTNTLYEEKYLDTKNKYGYFLDDNHPFVEIDTGYHNRKEIFIIKDSYANCIIPLLMPHYEKIYVLDLRYYKGSLFDLLDQYQTEPKLDVLVLYDCMHFIDEFKYK